MTRSKKLLVTVSGLMATTVLAMSMDITAQAGKKENCLSELSGGVAEIMEPGTVNAADLINATAIVLNLDLTGTEEDAPLVMANVKGVVNVRSEADENSEKVGELYKDCGGTLLERKDGWSKIKSGNMIGWAKDEFLLFDEEAQKLADDVGKTVATVEGDVIRVRKEPGADADVIGMFPKGEIVEVINCDDEEWICVDFEGKDGYVSAEYVDLTFRIDNGVTMEELKAKNKVAEISVNRNANFGEYITDDETTLLLAALIQCEAGGESYEGQVAVGAVVMNRVRSAAYPNTISGVIFASGQFTPAMNGKVTRVYESGKINESCINAAKDALAGTSPVGDLLHFRRVNGREGYILGNHVFY